VILAAGDIVDCWGSGDEATATLLDQFPNAIVATLGDHVYALDRRSTAGNLCPCGRSPGMWRTM
jgi:hypothetical protein